MRDRHTERNRETQLHTQTDTYTKIPRDTGTHTHTQVAWETGKRGQRGWTESLRTGKVTILI